VVGVVSVVDVAGVVTGAELVTALVLVCLDQVLDGVGVEAAVVQVEPHAEESVAVALPQPVR